MPLSDDDAPFIDDEERAVRVARAILSDICLYNAEAIEAGRDLSVAIAEGRALYCARVKLDLHHLFDEALLDTPLRPASAGATVGYRDAPAAPPVRSGAGFKIVPLLVLIGVVALGVGMYLALRKRGEEVGKMVVPGTLEIDVDAGDRLSFTADTEVLFRRAGKNAKPDACELALAISRDRLVVGRTQCDLFNTGPSVSIASSATYSKDTETGMRRLRTTGQRLACEFIMLRAGRVTVEATSNLATCVPRSLDAVAHVFRERASR